MGLVSQMESSSIPGGGTPCRTLLRSGTTILSSLDTDDTGDRDLDLHWGCIKGSVGSQSVLPCHYGSLRGFSIPQRVPPLYNSISDLLFYNLATSHHGSCQLACCSAKHAAGPSGITCGHCHTLLYFLLAPPCMPTYWSLSKQLHQSHTQCHHIASYYSVGPCRGSN